MHNENEKVRIEARSRYRRAELLEKRAAATVAMPIHPRSRAARQRRAIAALSSVELDLNAVALDPHWEPPLE